MGDTAGLDPFTVEFCEWRIVQLKREKGKLERKLTKFFTELPDCKGRKKRSKEVKSLVRKIKHPKTRNKLVEQSSLEDAKKHARQINSVENAIKFYEKKKCIILEQKEKLKDEKNEAKSDLSDATDDLPTLTLGHKDPATAAAVRDLGEKMKLINVAKAIVNIFYPIESEDREDLDGCCTGVIVAWDMANKTAKILTCDCSAYGVDDNSTIFVRWQYKEDGGFVEAKLLFFSDFYDLSLLEVAFQGTLLDIPTQIPHFSLSPPKLGDVVFALGRDKDLSLAVRRGTIMQIHSFDELCQGYLFVGYDLPECGEGGPVVDHHGDVVGLSIPCVRGTSAILPISTALSCLEMWTEFRRSAYHCIKGRKCWPLQRNTTSLQTVLRGAATKNKEKGMGPDHKNSKTKRIVRPLLDMCFRNAEVLDVVPGDIRFNGLVVDEVIHDSAAWKHGIRSGNVIVSFNDEKPPKSLLEFEDFLLSYGLKYLRGTCSEFELKVEVQDAPDVKRSITLHVPFSDVAIVPFSHL